MNAIEAILNLEPRQPVTFMVAAVKRSKVLHRGWWRRLTIPVDLDEPSSLVEYMNELGIDLKPDDPHELYLDELFVTTREKL